jgi:hypothetical protein
VVSVKYMLYKVRPYYCIFSAFMLMGLCHQLLFGFITNSQFSRVSPQSRLSSNGMIPWTVHRSLGIYLTDEENPRKSQLEDRLKIVRPDIASGEVPYLEMRQGEGNREEKKCIRQLCLLRHS